MKRTAALTAAFCLAGASLFGQDTLPVSQRSRQLQNPVLQLGTGMADAHSAAAFLHSPLPCLVETSAGFLFRSEEEASLIQEGDGLSEGRIAADAFHRLSRSDAVKGGASYRRGMRRNVRWNSSSDFTLLSPYVTADSVGGNLQSETYAFYGKYARRSGRVFWGAGGDYRACHEYRIVDPRPRNITSDFRVTLTGGLIAGRYAADLSATYRRYHQQQNVEYLNPLGAKAPQLHFTGLGSHYARFHGSGAYLNTRYRGNGWTVSAGLRPCGQTGLVAGVVYESFDAIKHLIGQNEAPFTELRLQKLMLYAAWRSRYDRWQAGTEADIRYERRTGMERVIDNVSTGIYDDIYSLAMYDGRTLESSLKGALSREGPACTLSLMPGLRYFRKSLAHLYPQRKLSYAHLEGGITLRCLTVRGCWTAVMEGALEHCKAFDGNFLIPAEYTQEDIRAFYTRQYAKFTDGADTLSFSLRFVRELRRGAAGYLAVEGQTVRYRRGDRSMQGGITLGFYF